MPKSPRKGTPKKWHHPAEVMKMHMLKVKKKALQARIAGANINESQNFQSFNKSATLENRVTSQKRKNPFVKDSKDSENKRYKEDSSLMEESTDQTLFKLLHQNQPPCPLNTSSITSFKNILTKVKTEEYSEVVVVKGQGELTPPIDWTLKSKIRLWSAQPFAWNQKLKISEEASGTTGFVRCLGTSSKTNLDTSPNAKFHQCCLYWQQPVLPWLTLFPRTTGKASENNSNFSSNATFKSSLQTAYSDSLRSLFQLIRTKQCPYFYVCANSFTVLFRAAGLCGISDVHAIITPTTRGFRALLRQEDIEFTMPLKKKRSSDQGYETLDATTGEQSGDSMANKVREEEEEAPDEQWLKSMGINAEDIKQINYTQAKLVHRAECEVDNSEQSLVLVEGVEVHALYNFLINCKSATSLTGVLAGIPPTLLAPVAFNGATLTALKVRESKVHVDNADFYSLELQGPILPSTINNLFSINSQEHSMSATFVNVTASQSFSKIKKNNSEGVDSLNGNAIFDKENLSDCGLDNSIIEQFCKPNICITNVECLKYNSDSKTYTWT